MLGNRIKALTLVIICMSLSFSPYPYRLFILSVLVCIHTLLAESNASKTYMLHLRWLPTHCLYRYCTISENITMDISKLKASPHFDWMDGACLHDHSFSEQDIKKIPDLNTYWTDPFHDTYTNFWVYYNYGACTVMGWHLGEVSSVNISGFFVVACMSVCCMHFQFRQYSMDVNKQQPKLHKVKVNHEPE
ncbi:unnamed protein product [Trichobilharzia szidati]|nr:unnamed protein product [Trichobilharzia szidati]